VCVYQFWALRCPETTWNWPGIVSKSSSDAARNLALNGSGEEQNLSTVPTPTCIWAQAAGRPGLLSGREEAHQLDPHFYPDPGGRPQAKFEAFLSGQAKGSLRFWGHFNPDFAEAFEWDVGGPVAAPRVRGEHEGPN
jgi:hypothetical protein